MGSQAFFATLAPSRPPHDTCDANLERADSFDLDELCVHMTLSCTSISPKATQDLLYELEASKQSRLRAWKALHGSARFFLRWGTLRFRHRLGRHSTQKERSWNMLRQDPSGFGTSHQELVLLGTPLPGRDHQGRMQKRLSARSSSVVESPKSSGGSDPKLTRWTIQTNDLEEELARRYHIPILPQRDLPISWNIAPTQDVLAIRLHPETKQRTLNALR